MKKIVFGFLIMALTSSLGCTQADLAQAVKDNLTVDKSKDDTKTDDKKDSSENTSTDTNTDSNSTTNNNDNKTDTTNTDTNTSTEVSTGIFAKATLEGTSETSCNDEKTLKSLNSNQATKFTFKNNSGQKLKFYWLDFSGNRKLYKEVNTGATYTQSTFITHPWVITNASDQCVGIYTPTVTGTSTLDITSVSDVTASSSTSTTVSDSSNIRALVDCLITKQPALKQAYELNYSSYLVVKDTSAGPLYEQTITAAAKQYGCL